MPQFGIEPFCMELMENGTPWDLEGSWLSGWMGRRVKSVPSCPMPEEFIRPTLPQNQVTGGDAFSTGVWLN